MYCPYCGSKNPDDSQFCASCGENLEKESSENIQKKHMGYIAYVILVTLFIANFILRSMILILITAILAVVYVLIRYMKFSRIGGAAGRDCPRCEFFKFNENYCVNCGYNLDDVLGYFKTNKYDIEMNKNYINIYKKYYYGRYYQDRLGPETFTIDKIKNLSIRKSRILNFPFLEFEYVDEERKPPHASKTDDKHTVKVKINEKIANEIEKILALGIYDENRAL